MRLLFPVPGVPAAKWRWPLVPPLAGLWAILQWTTHEGEESFSDGAREKKTLAREDACDAGGNKLVAHVAPAHAAGEQRADEVPGEKERDDRSQDRPDPAPLAELFFP